MYEVSKDLTPAEIVFKSKKVVNLPQEEQTKVLKDAIKLAYFTTGITIPTKEDFNAMVMVLTRDIQTSFKKITAKEIEIVFNEGCRKEYGDYFGLNPVTFYNWIKSYLQSEKRKKMLEIEWNRETGISEKDIKRIRNDYLNRCFYERFEIYKESNEWKFTPESIKGDHGLYQLLKYNGHATFTKEEKQIMKDLAVKRFGNDWLKNFELIGFNKLVERFIKNDTDVTKLITKFKPTDIEIT